MPVILASLLGGLIQLSGSLVGRVLIALGISYVTYTGISIGLDAIKEAVWNNLAGVPAELVGLLAIAKIDVCINIIFSAVTARLALNGLTSGGKITKQVIQ